MRVYFWDNANMSGFVGCQFAADWKTTYYIRDAQGNPMATYSRSSQNQEASYKLIERPIYGSSRVGIDNYSLEFIDYTAPTNGITNHVLGLKQYELSNHLGNVLTTISDKKFPIDNNGMIDHYVADITTASDYYPFGSPMDGRTFGSERYRYSFNTQEKVDEVYGKGNLNTALFWEYDTRLGRRWNLDPKPQINISDYAVMGNNPIANVDWLGDIWDPSWADGFDKKQSEIIMGHVVEMYTSSDIFRNVINRLNSSNTRYFVYSENQRVPRNSSGVNKIYQDAQYNDYKTQFVNTGGYYDKKQSITLHIFNFGFTYKSVIFEEVFHMGQGDYYKEKGIIPNDLYVEIEAKIAKSLAGFADNIWDGEKVQNFSKDYGNLMNKYLSGKNLSKKEYQMLYEGIRGVTDEILQNETYAKKIKVSKKEFLDNLNIDEIFKYLKEDAKPQN